MDNVEGTVAVVEAGGAAGTASAAKKSRKRIFGYDLIKCLAMFLVVLVHFKYYSAGRYGEGVAEDVLYRLTVVCVPLMFMTNGALLFARPLDVRKHLRKLVHLVVLTFVWRLISAFAMGEVLSTPPLSFGTEAFVTYLLGGDLKGFNLGHFWFVYVLAWVYLLFPMLRAAYDSEQGRLALKVLAAVVAVFFAGMKAAQNWYAPYAEAHGLAEIGFAGTYGRTLLSSYGYVLAYFVFGAFAAEWAERGRAALKWAYKPALLAGAGGSLYALHALSDVVTKRSDDVFAFVLTVCVFLLLWDVDVPDGPWKSVVEVLGANTFGVYWLHMFALMWLQLQFVARDLPTFTVAQSLGVVAAVYVGCSLVSFVLRFIPLVKRLFAL